MALPAGEINRHWTKNLIASADGKHLYASIGSNSDHAENGIENESGRAAIWKIDVESASTVCLRPGCAIRSVWISSHRPACVECL